MKITIEIDGIQVASQTVQQAAEQPGEQQEAAAPGLAGVYAKAAAMGAIDAGPAPRMEGGAGAGADASLAGQAGPPVFVGPGSGDQSGGAAPQLTPESGNG